MSNTIFGFPTEVDNRYAQFEKQSKGTLEYNEAQGEQRTDIFELAKAFLSISSMTHKKLQKLCYYAKAWHLAIYGENLIPEPFEAWVHGAVQPALYAFYRSHGYKDIPQVWNTSTIPKAFISFAKEIYTAYGHLSGDELERVNHQEEPWIKARGNLRPWESCTNIISEEDMKDFYRKMMV